MLRTPPLDLRLPDLARLADLGEVAAAGVHDPAVQPFAVEWTDQSPGKVARRIPVGIEGLAADRAMFTG